MKPVCLVDLDDTLLDFKTPMMEALNLHSGKSIHWSKYDAFDAVLSLYDISYQNFLQLLVDYQVLENQLLSVWFLIQNQK